MTPLSAFWHKTRRQYVPLTGTEWEAKSNIKAGDRMVMRNAGLVTSTPIKLHDTTTIYEITQAGIDAHRASLMGGAA